MGSPAGRKGGVWRVWAALDADARRVVAVAAGDRPGHTARLLWEAPPDGHRDEAIARTDSLGQHRAVVPDGRHAPGGKDSGRTAPVGRFRLALRQRCARFVRKALSFSKCPGDHVGALRYFIRLYNACRQ